MYTPNLHCSFNLVYILTRIQLHAITPVVSGQCFLFIFWLSLKNKTLPVFSPPLCILRSVSLVDKLIVWAALPPFMSRGQRSSGWASHQHAKCHSNLLQSTPPYIVPGWTEQARLKTEKSRRVITEAAVDAPSALSDECLCSVLI